MPMGQLSFILDGVEEGETHNFSVFIPSDQLVNGYWKQDNGGVWHNIATNIITEGNVTRIDFSIADNGIFDSNDSNGVISDPGGPAYFEDILNPPVTLSFFENRAAETIVFEPDSNFTMLTDDIVYTLSGADVNAFNVDPDTGVVTFKNMPDFETQSTFNLEMIATDSSPIPLSTFQPLTIDIKNIALESIVDFDPFEYRLAYATYQTDQDGNIDIGEALAEFENELMGHDPYTHYLTNGTSFIIDPLNFFDTSKYLDDLLDAAKRIYPVEWGEVTMGDLQTLMQSVDLTPLSFYFEYDNGMFAVPQLLSESEIVDVDNLMIGTSGDDSLYDESGSKFMIYGQEGNDLLLSSIGDDVFSGGVGQDTFYYNFKGNDVISDFVLEEDFLELNVPEGISLDLNNDKVFVVTENSIELNIDENTSLLLLGITYSDDAGFSQI